MNNLLYIGSFPPPYGGVTVKNALLFETLSQHVKINKLDLMDVKKLKMRALLIFIKAIVGRNGTLILGVSADWCRRITDFMYRFNRTKMRRSLLFVMGGRIPEDERYIQRLGCYKHVFVETESMHKAFEAAGAQNVSVYPNCRKRPVVPCQVRKTKRGWVHLVYFSLVSRDKGAQLVLDAARQLPNIAFDFYGRIDPAYEKEFNGQIESLSNAKYHGVFDSVAGDVIAELNQYDLHLFPTSWPNEGVPGILVETKMAAVPSVVSNCCYNAEIVDDRVDGVVLKACNAANLQREITSLISDPDTLDAMKAAALGSSERFYIDRYVDLIISELDA